MKIVGCLVIILLACSSVVAYCPGPSSSSSTGNAFHTYLASDPAFSGSSVGGVIVGNYGYGTSITGVCNGNGLCCSGSALQSFASTKLIAVKNAIINFGNNVNKFYSNLHKLATVASYPDLVSAYLGNVYYDLGITADQARGFLLQYANQADYQRDFNGFYSQAAECYNFYSLAYQKILCHACIDSNYNSIYSTDSFWQAGGSSATSTNGEVKITSASCSDWVNKCGIVWGFMHKVGSAVTVAAYINKKRDGNITYPVKNFVSSYFQTADSTVTISSIINAASSCGIDPYTSTCTMADKYTLCRAFIKLFDADPIARADTTFISSVDPTSSFNSRRTLVLASTGIVIVDPYTPNTGVDLTASGNVPLSGLTNIAVGALSAAEMSGWSFGYITPSSTSGSTYGSSSTSSQQTSESLSVGGTTSLSFSYKQASWSNSFVASISVALSIFLTILNLQ